MGSRAFIIKIIGPVLFFVIYVYVCHQLVRFGQFSLTETVSIVIFVFIPFATFISLPLFFWGRGHSADTKRWEIAFQSFAHFCLSYLSYLIVLILLRDLLAFIDLFFNLQWFSYSREETYALLALPFLLKAMGWMMIFVGPFVVRRKFIFKDLPDSAVGTKIVQISDLHIGPSVGERYVKKVVSKANDLYPDYVVLTGDIFDANAKRFQNEIKELGKLKAKKEIFYITGNHEYYWGVDQFFKKAQELGFTILDNKKAKSGELIFSGINDPSAKWFDKEAPDLEKALRGTSSDDFVILLAHQPMIADEVSKTHVRLQLSGHTHAGQFLPWSLVIGLFQKYARGSYMVGKLRLYVNVGTGFWGPADRLGTYSEITEIILDNK
jgi:predicted MPP superfamily phosphohydrolase